MSNSFDISEFKELYVIANKLCNTMDRAMAAASTGMSGYACHGAFKEIGKLQEAFDAMTKVRSLLREVSELDKVDVCVNQLSKRANKSDEQS